MAPACSALAERELVAATDRHDRFGDADVPHERGDPGGATGTTGRGAVRFSIFPGDIVRAPREWLERTTNLVSHHELDRGGHFAPFEQPDLFVDELHAFLEPFRR